MHVRKPTSPASGLEDKQRVTRGDRHHVPRQGGGSPRESSLSVKDRDLRAADLSVAIAVANGEEVAIIMADVHCPVGTDAWVAPSVRLALRLDLADHAACFQALRVTPGTPRGHLGTGQLPLHLACQGVHGIDRSGAVGADADHNGDVGPCSKPPHSGVLVCWVGHALLPDLCTVLVPISRDHARRGGRVRPLGRDRIDEPIGPQAEAPIGPCSLHAASFPDQRAIFQPVAVSPALPVLEAEGPIIKERCVEVPHTCVGPELPEQLAICGIEATEDRSSSNATARGFHRLRGHDEPAVVRSDGMGVGTNGRRDLP
mmetsp:Transcript_19590/g.55235  ORF Transcript_19590/g.55235 Transcript_19590/m.55235 type:complete len:315 (+) Transcript_19590:20-964(+)